MSYVKFKVTTDALNARSKPSINSKVVFTLPRGEIINVVRGASKISDGVKWYKVKVKGKTCWVSSKYVKRVTPRYRSLVLQKAKMVYNLIIKLGCKHTGGAKTLSQIKTKKVTTCATAVSVSLQEAGVLRKGTLISHTKRVGSSSAIKKKNTIGKAISGTRNLIPGTYKIVKIGKRYKDMPAKYKKPGNVLVYDSNIAIIKDADSIYSCNDGGSQKKNGKYVNNIVSSHGKNYCTQSPVLYVINIYN